MPVDHIRYDILVQEALRGMVRDVLAEAARNKGMPGEHHFFITFDTQAEGVRMSERLRAQYPDEMTVVLQHQFWDLKVTDEAFEVGLSFGGVAEKLAIPLEAIKAFADPSVQFTLQFETLGEAPEQAETAPEPVGKASRNNRSSSGKAGKTSVPTTKLPTPPGAETVTQKSQPGVPAADAEPERKTGGGAEVVRLDRFRKK